MSEKLSLARKAYWEAMDPEIKSARMRDMASKKQKNMSFKQRYDHSMKMVEARRSKRKVDRDIIQM